MTRLTRAAIVLVFASPTLVAVAFTDGPGEPTGRRRTRNGDGGDCKAGSEACRPSVSGDRE